MEDKLNEQEYERNRHFKAISKMFMNYNHQLHNIHKAANAGRSTTLWDPTYTKHKAAIAKFFGNSRRNSPENVLINA